MNESCCNILNGECESRPELPKPPFQLSENKDIYALSHKEMACIAKSFFEAKGVEFSWCQRCHAFNCFQPSDDLVFRVRCGPHATSQSSILEFVRVNGCPIIFTELYRAFRSTVLELSSPMISLAHCMRELKDVPALSVGETEAAVAALKYWIVCDPVEASEAIEAYQSVLPAQTFNLLRSEAIHACKELDTSSDGEMSSPERGLTCCCIDDESLCNHDSSSQQVSDDIGNLLDQSESCRFHIDVERNHEPSFF